MRPPREFSLEFGTNTASFWRCSYLLPEVSPAFDCTETILGEIFSTYASLPELSLEMRPPVSPLSGPVPSRHLFWRCTKLLPEVSPVFDLTEATLGEILPTYARISEVSLEMRPPREFPLGFGTIKASFFGAVAIYYQRSLQYSIVQKLLLGKSFPHTPAFQRSLWKCVLPVSPLSGSVPSRHFFGALAIYYRRSLQYSIVQKLLLGKSFSHTPAFQRSLSKCVPPVSSLSGSAPSTHLVWRCSDLLPEISPVFDRAEAILGEVFPTHASIPEVPLEMRPSRELSLGFGGIKAFFLVLLRSTIGSLSSIRSYTSYSWGNLSPLRQPSRGLSGNASPP